MENKAGTVLVVDDDQSIANLMRDFLEADGFRVLLADTAERAQALLAANRVDCILLDVMLPTISGFDLSRAIRQRSGVPILFLSARDSDTDKIRGLSLGGDDYIVKSATPSEVVARVKAVLRRTHHAGERPVPVLDFGHLAINLLAREVRVAGELIRLSAREFDLLRFFAEHPRQVITTEQLLERFWDDVGDRHTVTVQLGRLREKIEPNPAEPSYLVTIWGVGYRFEGVRQ